MWSLVRKLLGWLGIGKKQAVIPEAETQDVITLYMSRLSRKYDYSWDFASYSQPVAILRRIGNRVLELRVLRNLLGDDINEEKIRATLREYSLPQTTWVDKI